MFLLFHYKYINVSNIGLVMKHTRFEILPLELKIILHCYLLICAQLCFKYMSPKVKHILCLTNMKRTRGTLSILWFFSAYDLLIMF